MLATDVFAGLMQPLPLCLVYIIKFSTLRSHQHNRDKVLEFLT